MGWRPTALIGIETMNQGDDSNFSRIMAGLEEVAAIVEGTAAPARVHAPAEVDVRAIRQRLGLSQSAFAARFGFSAAAVKDWEQHRRRPEAAARILLTVIDREPAAVERALAT
jgi:putative transcriptional regulator